MPVWIERLRRSWRWLRAGGNPEDWHSIEYLRSVRLIDGSSATGDLMRRWTDTGWQYRLMTPAEELDELSPRHHA